MGKNKLKKFEDMKSFSCVLQYPWGELQKYGFPLKGSWHRDFFGNDNPIVLELGCGKGEYTIGLAKANPDRNYIGIDIKGARMWKGAGEAERLGMKNVAFLRTDIELLESFFAPEEVSEIWITFPDPQMQKCRKRLSGSRFLNLYSRLLRKNGFINLKTDSPFLYEYTSRLARHNELNLERCCSDIYGEGLEDEATSIKTFYEQQWLARGKKIKMIRFTLNDGVEVEEVDDSDIERDDYHSCPRGTIF